MRSRSFLALDEFLYRDAQSISKRGEASDARTSKAGLPVRYQRAVDADDLGELLLAQLALLSKLRDSAMDRALEPTSLVALALEG